MNASLQGFNLVRIERHFNVPFRLPLTGTDALPVTVSESTGTGCGCVTVTDTFKRTHAPPYHFFYLGRLAFSDFWRRQTMAYRPKVL
jgi:hypothetical protein